MPVHVAFYRDLTNAPFLRQQLLAGNPDFEYAMIDATSVLSREHLLSAVFKAMNDYLNNRLKSNNLHSEIVFSMSPNNNIAESFRTFGISDKTTSLLILKVTTTTTPEITPERISAHLAQHVQGTSVPFSPETLREVRDVEKIKKAYKLKAMQGEDEATLRRVQMAIFGAIALRGT
ncbi:hypothetical protein KEM55_002493 [Ascosphaera atra]|nr:hypothetical protein KEM55_002493 [Ascosphaera atra]